MYKNKKKAIELLRERDRVYYEWKNGIRKMLTDSKERKVIDENEEEVEGMLVTINGMDCYINAIKYNSSHNRLKVHIIMEDYKECDKWEFIHWMESSHVDSVLENIVWED